MKAFINRFFEIDKHNTSLKTEIIAGITTFMTMSYIIFVNPNILMQAGMDKGAVLIATCLSAAVASIIMGIWARYPFALAPGMGLNAYFTFTVVLGMGVKWQTALGAVFISGVLFLILSLFRFREYIITSIPNSLKSAIAAGIGTFIAFIGLQQAEIIVTNTSTSVSMGNLNRTSALLALLGIVIIGVLLTRKVKGAILWGILILTILGITTGDIKMPSQIFSLPPSVAPTFLQLDVWAALQLGIFNVIFIFFFIDIFDTVGTLVGLGRQAGYIKEDGNLPRANRAFLADAVGTVTGAMLGTSTTTSYIESSSGIAEGGRTGLTAVTTGIMFVIALFLFPVIKIVPVFATAPALVVIGSMMIKNVLNIDWKDPAVSLASFMTIIGMPLTYSIADGMAFGFIFYTLIKLFTGQGKSVNRLMYILTFLFLLRYFLMNV